MILLGRVSVLVEVLQLLSPAEVGLGLSRGRIRRSLVGQSKLFPEAVGLSPCGLQ